MNFLRFLFLFLGSCVFSSCGSEFSSPFSVDLDEGSFSYEIESGQSSQVSLEINGLKALQKGQLFRASDSLVVISSRASLDLILVLKESEEQASMQISLINPTDSARELSSLKINYSLPDSIEERLLPSLSDTGESQLWQWLNADSGQNRGYSLDLSGSSIVLLPEERILLPPLHFFSHLCSE